MNLRNVYKPVRDPETPLYSIPLGSPRTGPNVSYVHAVDVWCTVVVCVYGGVSRRCTGTGWVAGRVYRVGNTGTLPSHAARGGPRSRTAKRARKALQGPGVVVLRVRTYWGRRRSYPHPSGPVGLALPALPGICPYCRLTAKGARFHVIFHKVSQNRRVSPKVVHKASHSPYFQNGLRNSPLGILRFPLFPAFSHKELMAHY